MINDRDNRFIAGILIAIVIVLLGGKLLFAKLVYDDWSCAVAQCRKLK